MSFRQSPRRQLRNVQQLRRAFALSLPAHPETSYCRRGRPRPQSPRPSPPAPPRARGSRARPSPRPETPARRRRRSRSSARASAALPPLAGQRRNLPRLVVHTAIPPQIARIVKHDLFFAFWSWTGSRSAIAAPETRCDAPPPAACHTPSSLPESCARNAGRSTRSSSPCSAPASRDSPPPVAERADRCPAAAPDRPCIFPCAARRSSRPGSCITRTSASTISRPLGSYPPMQPSHRQYSCVPSKIGSAFFSINLSRSVALMPSALLPALQRQKELRPVIVLPRARIHRAAPQPNNDRHMLDAHRALKLARAARRALKRRLLRVVFAQQRLLRSRAHTHSGTPRSPSTISFGFSSLPVLAAGQCSVQRPHSTHEYACRLTSRVRSLPATSPKSSSPLQRRNPAEPSARQKYRHRAQHQVQMLGVRNHAAETTSSVSVCAHHSARAAALPRPARKTPPDTSPSARKISSAIKPDSHESSPSHLGRTRNRRTNSPAIPTAQATANAAAK